MVTWSGYDGNDAPLHDDLELNHVEPDEPVNVTPDATAALLERSKALRIS
jgi:hypothetical protein